MKPATEVCQADTETEVLTGSIGIVFTGLDDDTLIKEEEMSDVWNYAK
jgi:hypothetical protein